MLTTRFRFDYQRIVFSVPHVSPRGSQGAPRGADGAPHGARRPEPGRLAVFPSLVVRAGVEPPRLHDMRHICATSAFASGVIHKAVSEMLGHSSVAITSAIYVEVVDASKHEKAQHHRTPSRRGRPPRPAHRNDERRMRHAKAQCVHADASESLKPNSHGASRPRGGSV